MVAELLLVGGIVALAALFAWQYPEAAQRRYEQAKAARKVFFGLAAIALGFIFLATGQPVLMVIGGLWLAYAVFWLMFDDPRGEVAEVFG